VLNTHEHGDHTGGNAAMVAATGAQVLAHVECGGRQIREMTRGLKAGDVITVGRTVELECLDTPGHTMAHVCLLSRTQEPALFSGDTLFNAGAGNCHNGGHPRQLYQTFVGQLAKLPETTRIYPGHDYLARNLAFTLDREPSNDQARGLSEEAERMDPAHAVVTTLGLEKEINVFFRLQNAGGDPASCERSSRTCRRIPPPRTCFSHCASCATSGDAEVAGLKDRRRPARVQAASDASCRS
jgi:hydroxyacylglutathione hydrolase